MILVLIAQRVLDISLGGACAAVIVRFQFEKKIDDTYCATCLRNHLTMKLS